MVRDRPALHDGISWKSGTATGKTCSVKENQPICFAFKKRVIVQEGMLVIAGIHLSVLFYKQGCFKLGYKCAFKHTEKGWRRTKEAK